MNQGADWILPTIALIGGIGGSKIWMWLKSRGDNAITRESIAFQSLQRQFDQLREEIEVERHDKRTYRRIAHDQAGFSNALLMLLVKSFYDMNAVLASQGKPERYPDPLKAANEEADRIAGSMMKRQQQIYDNAEKQEQISELNKVAVEKQKETIKGATP